MYAISRYSDNNVSTVQGYGLLGEDLALYYSGQLPLNGTGAIDLTFSGNDHVLFASYDGVNVIEAFSPKMIEQVGTKTITGDAENEIAGLDFCSTYNWLLAAERYDSNVRVLEYDPVDQLFTKNVEIPMPTVTGGILGVCVDELETPMRVYISQGQEVVKYFDFVLEQNEPNFVYAGEIPIKRDDQGITANGIAVYNDGAGTKYIYSTGASHVSPNQYIIRTSLTDPNTVNGRIAVDMGSNTYAAGVDVDPETGHLFVTAGAFGGVSSSIQVYDALAWTSDPNDCQYIQIFTGADDPNISGPAGIVFTPKNYLNSQLWIHKQQVIPDPIGTCVEPNDLVTYRTAFHQGQVNEYNVVLKEFLPEETAFVSANPNTGSYDSLAHTYTWDIGDLPGLEPIQLTDPNNYLYFEVTVQVQDTAEPSGTLTSRVEVESDSSYVKDQVDTSICCWNAGVIYVDMNATGHNSGVNWENAYINFNDALARANAGCGSEIWVAQGTYSPGNAEIDTFQVPDNTTIYGGFAGTEIYRNQRNWNSNKTILNGLIDEGSFGYEVRNQIVMTMGDQSRLDGFTVVAAGGDGIWGGNVNFSIFNCIIENNLKSGIYHSGDGYTLLVTNSRIYNNQQDGIYAYLSTIQVESSVIYQNGLSSDPENTYYGIYLEDTDPNSSIIHNNTIVSNTGEGMYFKDNDPPDDPPGILNCILWNNAGEQIAGFNIYTDIFYSCVQDCIEVNNNISSNPNFAYGDPNSGNINFHLAFDSPCLDAGDPAFVSDPNETDIDWETRVYGDNVDIGADEVYDCGDGLTADDIYNPLDLDADGLINYSEFASFSAAWLSHDPDDPAIITDPNFIGDPNYVDPVTLAQWQQTWNPVFELDSTLDSQYNIDLADLQVFCSDYWLWISCWKWNEFYGL